MDKLKVLLADDHPVVRQGLRSLLSVAPDIEIVAEASDGLEAVDMVNEQQPDVVLMDIRMPNLDGLEATRRIKGQSPSVSVILLTMYDNDAYIVDAIKAGAGGYLLKDASRDLLVHTIRAVYSGGILIKTSLLRQAFSSLTTAKDIALKGKNGDPPEMDGLTPRERDVLLLMVEGQSNKEIGQALAISEDTAKKHVQAVISKLGVSDRTQAAVKAVRAGFSEDVA